MVRPAGYRPSDARAAWHGGASPCSNGARYSVARQKCLAPYNSRRVHHDNARLSAAGKKREVMRLLFSFCPLRFCSLLSRCARQDTDRVTLARLGKGGASPCSNGARYSVARQKCLAPYKSRRVRHDNARLSAAGKKKRSHAASLFFLPASFFARFCHGAPTMRRALRLFVRGVYMFVCGDGKMRTRYHARVKKSWLPRVKIRDIILDRRKL